MSEEFYGTHRGVDYFRIAPRLYRAEVNGRIIQADTLLGLRTIIGRVLNGLEPTDCKICRYYFPPSPISPMARCEKTSLDMLPEETVGDCWMFQLEKARR